MTIKRSCLGPVLLTMATGLIACSTAHGGTTRTGGPKIPIIVSSVDASAGSPTADQLQLLKEISDKAEKTGKEYYATIVALIGAQKHPLADKITISFNYTYKGVAATGDNHTDVSAPYAIGHPDDIPGVIVHELTHVAQNYTKDTGDTGWLTEGIADYVRWFNFEPLSKRPSPRQSQHPKATDAYQTTAAFLYWAVHKYDRNLVKKLNEAMYDGSYKPEIWTKLTGKSLGDLNTEWVATLKP